MAPRSFFTLAKPAVDRVGKRRGRPPLADRQPVDLPDPSRHLAIRLQRWGEADTLLTMADAAEYLCYTGERAADAAYQFLRLNGVRLWKRGNRCLVAFADLKALRTKAVRHSRSA